MSRPAATVPVQPVAGSESAAGDDRLSTPRVPDPHVLVVFGASGDLTRRKLLPAVHRLFRKGLLPDGFALLGFSREEMDDAAFRAFARGALREFDDGVDDDGAWESFARHLFYESADYDLPDGFVRLGARLDDVDAEMGTEGNRLFYLAIPPGVFDEAVEGLGRAGMVAGPGDDRWTRLVAEKPFGRDLESARALNELVCRVFDERQVFRIDHYLGKETVQNLLVFRFANVVWEPVWSRVHVDRVEITVAESVGVERRAGYYERAGALRDMVQSHLLQVLSLVAMEPPAAYDADSIRNEKVKVLRSVRRPEPGDVVRGQYAASADGSLAAYRDEPDVAPDSRTETYAAVRLHVDNWRWAGVPFFLRTGKRLPEKVSEVVVRFRPAPHPILDTVEGDRPAPNVLVVRIQPEEGISLTFEAKVPGLAGPLRPVRMEFDYCRAFGRDSPDAYQRLLLDAMLGDATLFARRDEVEAAWALADAAVAAGSRNGGGEPEPYPAASWGPGGADRLIRGDGGGEGGWWRS